MKIIKIIKSKDLKSGEILEFNIRKVSRGVVFDKNKNIGLLYVSKNSHHKLPGGGIDNGEDKISTLKRECLEELGCDVEIIDELGQVIEYRKKTLLEQYSYCYLARVVGEKKEPKFTDREISEGFQIKWVSLVEAVLLLKSDKPEGYEGSFIQIRDRAILKAAVNYCKIRLILDIDINR